MTENADSHLVAVQEHTLAAVSEIRQALVELGALAGGREHVVSRDVLRPAQRLVQGVAGVAEAAVDPLAQFVERQRALADQMAAWAELQHQLADSMAAWADMQRDLANTVALWLAPVEGAAHMTTRMLHELAKERPVTTPATSDVPTQRSDGKRTAKGTASRRHR